MHAVGKALENLPIVVVTGMRQTGKTTFLCSQPALSARWPNASLYFWALQSRHEVDFVIEAGRSCLALEIKSAARWQEKVLAGLKAFLKVTPHCKGGILCHNGENGVQLGPKLWALPTHIVLS